MPFRRIFQHPLLRFSKRRIWIFVALVSWSAPIGIYNWMGDRYLSDWRIWLPTTAFAYTVCMTLLVVQESLIFRIMKRFPQIRQTLTRIVLEFLVFLTTIGASTLIPFYTFQAIPYLNFHPDKLATNNLWLGTCTIILFIGLYEGLYSLTKWKENSLQAEAYKREVLLNQLDVLKNQINPHFLFNSLNALSSLISEEPKQAEEYVDELAKGYRYLLQTNENTLTTLENELTFIQSYYHLLKMRHGTGVTLTLDVPPAYHDRQLPPLSLQLLVENAVKHNRILAGKPLQIQIELTPEHGLRVRNNLQRKTTRVASNRVGLTNIVAKYRLLGQAEPTIVEQDGFFTVTLPLLKPSAVPQA
ncbi:histidine kinase [Larkinella arboricola]|uniref:Histidine kinase n=1 Tax=Larkinella arboricola TaxID=643671 RepID=A0A327X1U3_LARAB|nr:histidine kinase [Larkinella arboricola]RAK00501.1 histidine kinase [Larkinella arboricola]